MGQTWRKERMHVDTMLVEWTEFLWKKLGIDVIFYCEMGGQKWCERSYSRDATEKRNREGRRKRL